MWYINAMEYYSPIKKMDEILKHGMTWKNLGINGWSERSQTQKAPDYLIWEGWGENEEWLIMR